MAKSEYQKLKEQIAVAAPELKKKLQAKLKKLQEQEARTNRKVDKTPAIVKDLKTARTRQQADFDRLSRGIKSGNKIGAAPATPTGTTRNWRNGYGAQSKKPSSGDPSTWKKKTETTSSGGSSGGGGSSSGSSGSPRRTSSSSSSSSTPPRRKPPTAPPPVPKGLVEKTADRYKAKTKTVKDRKTYLQTKKGGGLSERMSEALADKDALKFKPSKDEPKRKPVKANRSKWRNR